MTSARKKSQPSSLLCIDFYTDQQDRWITIEILEYPASSAVSASYPPQIRAGFKQSAKANANAYAYANANAACRYCLQT
jgi:hypothetical protein